MELNEKIEVYLRAAEALEAEIAQLAAQLGRGSVPLALNNAKTLVGGAVGWLLRAQHDGGAVGSG